MASAVDDASDSFPPKFIISVVDLNPRCDELVDGLTGERAKMGIPCTALFAFRTVVYSRKISLSRSDQQPDELFSVILDKSQWSLVELIRLPVFLSL